jgi:hypothetical protein
VRHFNPPLIICLFELLMFAAALIDFAAFPLLGYGWEFWATQIIWFGVLTYLIWSTARRRKNWARWTLFFIYGSNAMFLALGWRHARHFEIAYIQVFTDAIAVLALSCTFVASRRWFFTALRLEA